MMMSEQQEYPRVEAAVTASASGDLTWDRWSLDSVTAVAMAGVRNPVGFAMIRYLSEDSVTALFGLKLALASQLVRRGMDGITANELSIQAIEFWNNMRCPDCNGSGVGMHSGRCPRCGGSGDRPVSDAASVIQDAVGMLIEAQEWMERQLRSRLKGKVFSDGG